MSREDRDGGYDDWLAAIDAGEGYYLTCESGHGSLPPRRVCPHCGGEVDRRDLPASGRVETYTVVHVGTPDFVGQTPYVTAIADFGDVSITGLVRGVDTGDVEVGMPVGVDVGTNPETDDRVVVLRPR
ncbi:MAG: Zn-ribbon domain-containing OB-fold protein [Haloferacaceae archaeon]